MVTSPAVPLPAYATAACCALAAASPVTGFSSADFDTGTIAVLLDPQAAKDDNVRRVYRQASIGAYDIASAQGVRMRIDGITIDDVGVRPSTVQLPDFLAMMASTGAVPTPAQMREMIERMAKLYEGLHIGNSKIMGMSLETPQGPLTVSAIRFNMDKGKSDFAFEDMAGRTPTGPFS